MTVKWFFMFPYAGLKKTFLSFCFCACEGYLVQNGLLVSS